MVNGITSMTKMVTFNTHKQEGPTWQGLCFTCMNGFSTQSPAFDIDLKLTPRSLLTKFLGVFWPGRILMERWNIQAALSPGL